MSILHIQSPFMQAFQTFGWEGGLGAENHPRVCAGLSLPQISWS